MSGAGGTQHGDCFPEITLADGSTIFLSVYSATMVWDGAPRDVEVLATTGRQPLLGTLLLDGYKLTADFEDGGTVTIDPL